MASRTTSIPTRAVKLSDRPANRSGVRGSPTARSAVSSAAQHPRQHGGSSPASAGSGFTIRLSGELTPNSGARPSSSTTTPQKSHSVKEHSSRKHPPDVIRTRTNNASKHQIAEVPEKFHSATKPVPNKRLPAPKSSKIPKPSPGKHRLTNTELKGILAMVDSLNEGPEESAEKKKKYNEEHTTMSPSQLNLEPKETKTSHPDSANNSHMGKTEDLLKNETTWRQGDDDTGELGLGGISRQDRARRAGQPRTKNESPADLDMLISQIGPEKMNTESPGSKKKDPYFNTDDTDIADLMGLTEGYGETVCPKSSPDIPKRAAPGNKLSKGDLDQLLGMIDSEDTSATKRETSDRNEVTENTGFVDTWRTGDGDEEAMNELRTKPRDRDVPSQSPDWSIEDLITNRHSLTARDSREDSPVRGRRDVSVSESDNDFSDDETANTYKHDSAQSTSKNNTIGLSEFDNFIDSSIISTSIGAKSPETSRQDNSSVAHPKHVSAPEKPLLSSRASNMASTASPRNTHSRLPIDEQRQFSDQKANTRKKHFEENLDFFNDIIISKRSLEPASSVPSRQKTRPPPPAVKPKPFMRVSETHQGHSRAMDNHQPNSDANTREHSKPARSRQGDARVSQSSDESFTKRQPRSPVTASRVSQEKSRSARPVKSKTPEKSSISQPKSRSTSPSKSRSTSPIKSRSTSPIKSGVQNTPGSADRFEKSSAGGNSSINRKRYSPTRSPQYDDYRGDQKPIQTSGDHLSSSSDDKNRHNFRRVTPEPRYSAHTSPTKSSPAQAATTQRRKQDVVHRSKPEDKADAKPKRKSLSLAGMSNPYRHDKYGLQLRNLIQSTEALEKQMFTLMKPSK